MAKRTVTKPKKAKKAPPLAQDQVMAGELRAAMVKALLPVCAILDQAQDNGLTMSFNIDTKNPTGRNQPTFVGINRNL